jgi:hypothetical protein
MRCVRPIGSALIGIALLLPIAAKAQLATWSQERVAQLATELKQKTDHLYDVFYKQPVPTIGSSQARSYLELKQEMRRIRNEARHLHDSLAKGQGYEETLPIYNNLMEKVRDAQEDARRVFTSDELIGAATAAGDVMRRIAPYYDATALRNPVKEAEDAAKGN